MIGEVQREREEERGGWLTRGGGERKSMQSSVFSVFSN